MHVHMLPGPPPSVPITSPWLAGHPLSTPLQVLELSDLTLEPLVSQAELRLRLGKVSQT